MGRMQTLRGKGNGTSMNEPNKRMPAEYYAVCKEEDQRILGDRSVETEQKIDIEVLLFSLTFGPVF